MADPVLGSAGRVRAIMRLIIAFIFAGLALWRAVLDWQTTIGEGYAYRLMPVGYGLELRWPNLSQNLEILSLRWDMPWLWDPVLKTLFDLPLALVLALMSVLLWMTRSKEGR